MKKVAFYGVGITGIEHVKAFQRTGLYQIVCVSSRSKEKSENTARQLGVPFVSDIDDIYRKYAPAILVICVPPTAVLEVIRKALQHPWEILVEKPAGITLAESTTIFDLYKSRKYPSDVWVGMNRRMLPSTLIAKELLDKFRSENKIAMQISIIDQQDTASAKNYGHPEIVIQNWHFANSVHLVDLAMSFLRNYPSVAKITKEEFGEGEIVTAKLKNGNGDSIEYKAYWNIPAPWSLEIITDVGWIKQSPIEQLRTLFEQHEYHDLTTSKYSEPVGVKPGFYNQAIALSGTNSMLNAQLCTLSESHKVMTILDKIYGK